MRQFEALFGQTKWGTQVQNETRFFHIKRKSLTLKYYVFMLAFKNGDLRQQHVSLHQWRRYRGPSKDELTNGSIGLTQFM